MPVEVVARVDPSVARALLNETVQQRREARLELQKNVAESQLAEERLRQRIQERDRTRHEQSRLYARQLENDLQQRRLDEARAVQQELDAIILDRTVTAGQSSEPLPRGSIVDLVA